MDFSHYSCYYIHLYFHCYAAVTNVSGVELFIQQIQTTQMNSSNTQTKKQYVCMDKHIPNVDIHN